MAGKLFQRNPKSLDQIVAIDLGGRTTKAVAIQRKNEQFFLNGFALVDAPIVEKAMSVDLLSEHLKSVVQALDTRQKQVILGLGSEHSFVRIAEVPMMAIGDLRLMLKLNSKHYLQQDLPDHLYDAFPLPSKNVHPPEPNSGDKLKPLGMQKQRMLVGGARRSAVEDLQTAGKNAGLNAHSIVPSGIAFANAFEYAEPEKFAKEIVALVDIGFKHSTITILDQGELALNRMLSSGGDKLTAGLAESLGVSYAEADGIKVKLMGEVENNLEPLLAPLSRELRASIDFFEHQNDRQVTQVFVSGGSSRAEFILRSLQSSVMIPCSTWNPTGFMQLALSPQQMGELESVAPMLTVAMGLAITAF